MADEGLARGDDRQDEQVAHAINERLMDNGDLNGTENAGSGQRERGNPDGDVDSQETRDRAEAIAAAVSGVRYVINNLRVRQEGTTGRNRLEYFHADRG